MGNSLTGLLLFAVLSLLALLAVELHFGVVPQVALRPASSTVSEGAPEVPSRDFRLPSISSYAEMVDRPLFSESRRVEIVEEAAVVESDAQPEPQPAPVAQPIDVVIAAIIITGEEKVALLRDGRRGEITSLHEGDTISDWRLDEIRPDSLVLKSGDQSTEVHLRRYDGSRAPAAPTAQQQVQRAKRKLKKAQNDGQTDAGKPEDGN